MDEAIIERCRKAAIETWKKSEQTTRLEFLEETKDSGGTYYQEGHKILLRLGVIAEESKNLKIPPEHITALIVAHELGHSVDPELEKLTKKQSQRYKNVEEFFLQGKTKKTVRNVKLLQENIYQKELSAWEYAKQYMNWKENENTNEQYRDYCLASYSKAKNEYIRLFSLCSKISLYLNNLRENKKLDFFTNFSFTNNEYSIIKFDETKKQIELNVSRFLSYAKEHYPFFKLGELYWVIALQKIWETTIPEIKQLKSELEKMEDEFYDNLKRFPESQLLVLNQQIYQQALKKEELLEKHLRFVTKRFILPVKITQYVSERKECVNKDQTVNQKMIMKIKKIYEKSA